MKKIVALFIAITLILALCPLSFAADIFDGYTYVFSTNAFSGEKKGVTQNVYALVDMAASETSWLDSNVSASWIPAGWRTTNTVSSQADGLIWNLSKDYAKKPSYALLAVKVNVSEGGKYIPALTYSARSCAPVFEIYLVKEGTAVSGYSVDDFKFYNPNDYNKTDPAKRSDTAMYVLVGNGGLGDTGKLGELDMWADYSIDYTNKETKVFDETTLEGGNYYLVFRPVALNGSFEPLTGTASTASVCIKSFSLEYVPTEAEEAAGKAFDAAPDSSYTKAPETTSVTRFAYYGDGVQAKKIGETATVDYGASTIIDGVTQTYTDTETGKTYNFSYWAKGLDNGVGNKQILSTALSFSYKPHDGNNYLIAVYEEEDKAQEAFYNYNGQLLTNLKIENNELPALPAMAGLGDAIKWVQRGTNLEFDGGAQAPTNGDMVFMAKYNEPAADITINGEKKYSYDEEIICKNLPNTGYNEATFSYWTRKLGDGEQEIVSLDPDYSFYAFTDCTIAAVCEGKIDTITNARKILLSTFAVGDNLTAVMAEFIGFDEGVKEKGIMFGDKKIAMTSNFAQFTVTNDTDAPVTVTGYAIVGDDKYVGGEVTVAAKE